MRIMPHKIFLRGNTVRDVTLGTGCFGLFPCYFTRRRASGCGGYFGEGEIMADLIFGFSHYGGECPKCNSNNTALWLREIEVIDGYNDWEEWITCHDCKHEWEEPPHKTAHTYLINNGYTEGQLDSFMERARKMLEKFKKDNE